MRASWRSAVAQAVGGKGGGRPDMAEAGGKDVGGAAGRRSWASTRGRGDAVSECSTSSSSAPAPPASPAASSSGSAALRAVLIDKGCVVNSLYNYPTNMVFFTTPELLEIGDIPRRPARSPWSRPQVLPARRRPLRARHSRRDTGAPVAVGDSRCTRTSAAASIRRVARHPRDGLLRSAQSAERAGRGFAEGTALLQRAAPYLPTRTFCRWREKLGGHRGLELYWAGARVTLSIAARGSSDHVKYWIKPNIENRIKNGEIPAHFRSTVREIRRKCDVVCDARRRESAKNDFVFAMTGYRPDTEFLDAARDPSSMRIAAGRARCRHAGERPQGNLPGGRTGGWDAHQRDLHRERALPRRPDRQGASRNPCGHPEVDLGGCAVNSSGEG